MINKMADEASAILLLICSHEVWVKVTHDWAKALCLFLCLRRPRFHWSELRHKHEYKHKKNELVRFSCAYTHAYVDPVFTCLHMCLCLCLCLCASENQALTILNGRESAYSSSCYFFIVTMDRILNTIKYRIKWYMAQFPSKGGRLIQVKITKKDKHGTSTGWPRPCGRLIQVTNTAFVWAKNRDFENCPLNRVWSLNTGPLYTGSNVSVIGLLLNILFMVLLKFKWTEIKYFCTSILSLRVRTLLLEKLRRFLLGLDRERSSFFPPSLARRGFTALLSHTLYIL